MRRAALIGAVVACAAGGGGAFALAASGGERDAAPSAAPPAPSAALPERPQTELPPLPEEHEPKVVEPVAGESGDAAAETAPEPTQQAPPTDAPRPDRAASSGDVELSRPSTAGDGIRQATALPNGIALPPLEAPEPVRQMIEAGNVIARSPYLWGGGHGKWVDKGYDCSGSVSFVLASAGYLEAPLASGPLMSWGEPGPGKWVTIYSHEGHVFMEVAGIRFDTSGASETGSRWQNELRSTAGFVARHPPGL
jgi:cell wall-associated NlpC family hydrolase